MIYIIIGFALMLTAGVVLANYELKRTKQKRREQLQQRARRCVRRND